MARARNIQSGSKGDKMGVSNGTSKTHPRWEGGKQLADFSFSAPILATGFCQTCCLAPASPTAGFCQSLRLALPVSLTGSCAPHGVRMVTMKVNNGTSGQQDITKVVRRSNGGKMRASNGTNNKK